MWFAVALHPFPERPEVTLLPARRTLLAASALVLALSACTSDPAPTPSPTPSGSASQADVVLPEDAAGEQATWVLAQLERGAQVDPAEVNARFAEVFLDEVPAEDLATLLGQLRAQGPWRTTAVQHGPGWVVVRLEASAGELEMQLALDAEERISTLFFGPAAPDRETAGSLEDLASEVEGLAGSTSLFLARVVDGRCEPVDGFPAGTEPGASLPIGSMVKLWVLAAVVDAVARGEIAWDDEVEVTEELRSLPTGRLQDEPAGTRVSVREAAELMISISDNTATDLLIDAVGRDRVEQAFADLGHAEPERNIPLVSTRELFILGWSSSRDWRERWQGADAEGRAAILETLATLPLDVDLARLSSEPAFAWDVDWFASGADLCAAHVALAERSDTPAGEPLREILSANPGTSVPEGWDHVAFKGGSAPGTMGGSWYAEGPAGAVVVVLQTASETRPTHASTMAGIAEDALRLLAES